jgi:hypothetical protein
LKLPIDERGRRRAANRAEWFNQVNKPLEVHDIFGAPQIGFGLRHQVHADHEAARDDAARQMAQDLILSQPDVPTVPDVTA